MILQRQHPLLVGCRLFLMPAGTGLVNLVGPTGAVKSGSPAGSKLGTWPALQYTETTPDFWTLPANNKLFKSTAVSILMRVRADSISTVDVNKESVILSNTESNASGWRFFFSDFSGAETGYCFVVYQGGNFFFIADSSTAGAEVGKNRVAGASYNPATKNSRFYKNGRRVTSSINTDHTWTMASSGPVHVGALTGGTQPFQGAIGWIMVFDRLLSDHEFYVLSDDRNWPFMQDHDFLGQVGPPVGVPLPKRFLHKSTSLILPQWVRPLPDAHPPPPVAARVPLPVRRINELSIEPWLTPLRFPSPPDPIPPGPPIRFPFLALGLPGQPASAAGIAGGVLRFPPRPAPPGPPPPVSPPADSFGGFVKPFVPRDPTQDPRMRVHTQIVADFSNSMMRSGQLVQIDPAQREWRLFPPVFIEPRAPTADDDTTAGIGPGSFWVNSLNEDLYICVNAKAGSARWKGPI